MFFNHRKTCAALQPPPGLGPADIATQSSICTGETIIGFRQPGTDRLLQAVVVHSPQDVADFYRSYGFSAPEGENSIKRMNFCVFSQFRLFLRKKHMFCLCTICK